MTADVVPMEGYGSEPGLSWAAFMRLLNSCPS